MVSVLPGMNLWAETPGENPFTTIGARNVFSLQPVASNVPGDSTPAVPLPKIMPNGIMQIFGKAQVLFTVMAVPGSGQAKPEQSYLLNEGDAQDGIKVAKIDLATTVITFYNHGVVQLIALNKGTATGETGRAALAPGSIEPTRAAALAARSIQQSQAATDEANDPATGLAQNESLTLPAGVLIKPDPGQSGELDARLLMEAPPGGYPPAPVIPPPSQPLTSANDNLGDPLTLNEFGGGDTPPIPTGNGP